MNLIDVSIIIILFLGFFVGYRRGLIPSVVSLIGFFGIVIGSFLLKNYVSIWLCRRLPFFPFAGALKGLTVLNILVYEVIAFFVIMFVLTLIFKIVLKISKIFEKFLKITIIYVLPSKILGGIVGIFENFIVVFIMLYILSLPIFNMEILNESKFRKPIIENTPVLSELSENTFNSSNEIFDLIEKYKSSKDDDTFNKEALDVLLKYKITTPEVIRELTELKKIKIKKIDKILERYENDKN